MNVMLRHAPMEHMLADIRAAVAAGPEERDVRVADAIAGYVSDPTLLAGRDCPCRAEGYVRHLLHADAELSYAVVALVWRPGQMSPVHAHRTWCALGVHRGALTESFYEAREGEDPSLAISHVRRPGETCHGPADPRLIHRIANLSCGTAVSIHAYGASFDRLGSDVNLVYAA